MSVAFIFDLDGVLVDSKEIHFNSLNLALSDLNRKYVITQQEQRETYEGLPTKAKLEILTLKKGLPKESYDQVWKAKQAYSSLMFEGVSTDAELIELLKLIKHHNIKIGVASNSIRSTLDVCLQSLGIADLVDVSFSNEDVEHPKPSPEIYLKTMSFFGVTPQNTYIFEDSDIGQRAARDSGANLVEVLNRSAITVNLISKTMQQSRKNTAIINELPENSLPEQTPPTKIIERVSSYKKASSDANILIPMAGLGSRFARLGYDMPKPLIDIVGKPMIQRVVESLKIDGKYIFVVQKMHEDVYGISKTLREIVPDCEIVYLDQHTQGAASTTLLAKEYIDNDKPLIIANSDQIVDWNSEEFLSLLNSEGVDGVISTFESDEDKWSYVKVRSGRVVAVAEKLVISNEASVGIYGWKHGKDYVEFAERMISQGIKTNGEFYICPVYNQAIFNGRNIKSLAVSKMNGVGTPEDLRQYIEENFS